MLARLGRGWRVLGTALCFVSFGLGAVLLTLLVFPLMQLLVRSPQARKRRTQRLLSLSCRAFVALMQSVGIMTCHVEGRNRLDCRGCLIVANHPSLIDVVMLIALMPQVDCLFKRQLRRNPFIRGVVAAVGYIGNDDGPALIEECRAALAAGNRVLVFPEGTRTTPGQALQFHRGAANIALHAGADIVPATIIFSETTLTKSDRWYHVPKRKFRVTIGLDRPITVQPYIEQFDSMPLAARKLTHDLREYYVGQLAQAGRLPEHDRAPDGGLS